VAYNSHVSAVLQHISQAGVSGITTPRKPSREKLDVQTRSLNGIGRVSAALTSHHKHITSTPLIHYSRHRSKTITKAPQKPPRPSRLGSGGLAGEMIGTMLTLRSLLIPIVRWIPTSEELISWTSSLSGTENSLSRWCMRYQRI
jgi:hypothetical protein